MTMQLYHKILFFINVSKILMELHIALLSKETIVIKVKLNHIRDLKILSNFSFDL